MHRVIPKKLLRSGFRLPGALEDRNGRKLMEAGVILTAAHLCVLRSLPADGLFGGEDWDACLALASPRPIRDEHLADPRDHADAKTSGTEGGAPAGATAEHISVASLRDGMRLAQDIYDDADVLLLAAGMEITPRFLGLLGKRHIKTVHLHATPPSPAAGTRRDGNDGSPDTDISRKLDELLPKAISGVAPFHPIRAWRRPRIALGALRSEAKRGLRVHSATGELVADVGETLQAGGKASATQLQGAIKSFADMVTLDLDLLPLIVSLQRTRDEYLFDHCVNVAILSMTLASQLGLGRDQILELGMAGLLHDIGMLRVPGRIRLAPRRLSPAERREIDRHPMHTLDLMEGIRGLPTVVRIISYQVHERCDGSGYPHGRTRSSIHPYTSIVSTADMFAAMTRPRPYRPAMMPYEAAKTVLVGASEQVIDREVVRALLDAVSLFPIGSVVELSNGVRGQVLRANPDLHTKPVIECLDTADQPTDTILDLSIEKELCVVRALPASGGRDNDRPTIKTLSGAFRSRSTRSAVTAS